MYVLYEMYDKVEYSDHNICKFSLKLKIQINNFINKCEKYGDKCVS